ncbi:MAG: hypothetical protein OEN21_11520 [Myxococcales bacterium]|nr:hypothetical protein [Myxococcales bacterium]
MTQIGGTNRYTGSFDANQYPETIGQITINVTAADLSGNDRTQSVRRWTSSKTIQTSARCSTAA